MNMDSSSGEDDESLRLSPCLDRRALNASQLKTTQNGRESGAPATEVISFLQLRDCNNKADNHLGNNELRGRQIDVNLCDEEGQEKSLSSSSGCEIVGSKHIRHMHVVLDDKPSKETRDDIRVISEEFNARLEKKSQTSSRKRKQLTICDGSSNIPERQRTVPTGLVSTRVNLPKLRPRRACGSAKDVITNEKANAAPHNPFKTIDDRMPAVSHNPFITTPDRMPAPLHNLLKTIDDRVPATPYNPFKTTNDRMLVTPHNMFKTTNDRMHAAPLNLFKPTNVRMLATPHKPTTDDSVPATSKNSAYKPRRVLGESITKENDPLVSYNPFNGSINRPQFDVFPLPYCIWQGRYKLYTKGHYPSFCEGIQANLARSAPEKAFKLAPLFSKDMLLEESLISAVWTDHFAGDRVPARKIHIYFFARDPERPDSDYRILLQHMIENNMCLRGTIGGFDLLIFSSNKLDYGFQRWNGHPFLWGVFKEPKPISRNDQINVDTPITDSPFESGVFIDFFKVRGRTFEESRKIFCYKRRHANNDRNGESVPGLNLDLSLGIGGEGASASISSNPNGKPNYVFL